MNRLRQKSDPKNSKNLLGKNTSLGKESRSRLRSRKNMFFLLFYGDLPGLARRRLQKCTRMRSTRIFLSSLPSPRAKKMSEKLLKWGSWAGKKFFFWTKYIALTKRNRIFCFPTLSAGT